MGASTREMFSGEQNGEAADAGTYGAMPAGFRLPDAAHLGNVRLQVSDLSRSLEFYQTVLGMRVLRSTAESAELASQRGDTVLVTLEQRPGSRSASGGGRLGLYHFALLLPDRPSLGRLMRHLAESGVRAGGSDHLVSEAIYLHDPDGLGIEVYRDRARSEWRRVGRELMMATDPIDGAGLLAAAGERPWTGLPAGTTMGHVHLHVGDIERSAAYFSEALGFDRMVARYPGALFLGAGGYHHHLGTNIWAGPDARQPAEDDARLLEWTLALPDAGSRVALSQSLVAGGFRSEADENDLITEDPWGTRIRVVVE